ncbi:type III-A CRISPR-associated CARF protein Csm6 [Streptococcus uberis]|uniref:type III-A CRISPR-associated CARF protein Csm6 n=1 Tax=Streptococcus uberis TaxID=1349 RepID=UPI0027DD6C7A|nr:type III-A CRISPR-associated CARF protein Csm6 [Streptococcus uberis]MCK1241785.1 type III-A CRISPR-associated CARF protein Csm6 [Streptococcus uberis]
MTTTFLSAVGTTDPIRNFYDGPLLHIARVYKPDKIILIFSEELLSKKDRIITALLSIENYRPEIEIEETILSNDEVFIFDKMFNVISNIVSKYTQDDLELILNLSSGTPQIISALFAINRINDYNVKAVQVSTPVSSSNENIQYENQEDIDTLIETNEDNKPDFVDRTIEDTSEKFSQALLKRNLRNLIEKYDYQAVRDILITTKNMQNRKKLLNILEDVVKNIQTQSIPSELQQSNLKDNEMKALSAYLLIDLQRKRGNIAECLIRIKSLTEFIIEDYLNKCYPDIIQYDDDNKPYPSELIDKYLADQFKQLYPNRQYRKNYLSLPSYIDILRKYDETEILKFVNKVKEINKTRNLVAHSLNSFEPSEIKKLNNAMRAIKDLLNYTYKLDKKYFKFFETLNKRLLELLL